MLHPWPSSKSKFIQKSDRVNLVPTASRVCFIYPMSGRYSTKWDRKGWPDSEIQMYYGCPWLGSPFWNRAYDIRWVGCKYITIKSWKTKRVLNLNFLFVGNEFSVFILLSNISNTPWIWWFTLRCCWRMLVWWFPVRTWGTPSHTQLIYSETGLYPLSHTAHIFRNRFPFYTD